MLNAEGVEKLIEVAGKYQIEEINDHKFHVSSRGVKRLDYPEFETLEVFSLDSLLTGMKSRKNSEDCFVNIDSYDKVSVLKLEHSQNCKLQVMMKSDAAEIFESFPYGQKLNQEDFVINLLSKFVADKERDELLKLVSSVTDGETKTSDDDGVSQTVTMKSGISLVQQKVVRNIWNLKTYKTFPEVEQPVIPYVLRVYKGGAGPVFALHECDGGLWKVQTVGRIKDYLKKNGPADLKVI